MNSHYPGQYPSDEQIERAVAAVINPDAWPPHYVGIVRWACDWAAAVQRERDAQICKDLPPTGMIKQNSYAEACRDCTDVILSQTPAIKEAAPAPVCIAPGVWESVYACNLCGTRFSVNAEDHPAKCPRCSVEPAAQEHDENSYRWRLGRRLSEYLDSIICDDRIALDPCDSRDIDSLLEEIFSVPADATPAQAEQKDAERYRWLRERDNSLESHDGAGRSCYHMVGSVRELKHGAELDAAVDAAIGARPAIRNSQTVAEKPAPTHIEVAAEVRYWEDATVNGIEDTDGSLIPCRDDALWLPIIRLADGVIEGWPVGTVADVHYKVCDQGFYYLSDGKTRRISKYKSDYVPDMLSVGDDGFGDYIIMKIGSDGCIEGWEAPTINPDEWGAIVACETCKGSGEVGAHDGQGPESHFVMVNCPECGGTGEGK